MLAVSQTSRVLCGFAAQGAGRHQPLRSVAEVHASGWQCDTARGPRRAAFRGAVSVCAAVAVAAEPSLDVTQMEPLGDRVLVKPFEAQKVTESGLLLAGTSNDAMQDALLGEVLAVGAEVEAGVSKGDTVIFSKYSSSDVKLPAGGEVCFVAQKSILATLR